MKLTDKLEDIEIEANKILNLLDINKSYYVDIEDLYIEVYDSTLQVKTLKWAYKGWCLFTNEDRYCTLFSSLSIEKKVLIHDYLIDKL